MDDNFQIKDDQLLQYFHKARELGNDFKTLVLKHIPREENVQVDSLSKLANDKGKSRLSSMIRQVLMKPSIEWLSVSLQKFRFLPKVIFFVSDGLNPQKVCYPGFGKPLEKLEKTTRKSCVTINGGFAKTKGISGSFPKPPELARGFQNRRN